jgi:hypothetical protein
VLTKRQSASSANGLMLRALVLLIGCSGLMWGITNVMGGANSDALQNFEDRLLQFETFDKPTGIRALTSAAAKELSPCDSHAQRALLLLEMPLAEAALRSGAVRDFDQHIRSIQDRARRMLACAPRDSLAWLILFGLDVEQGQLDERSFDFLDASYETSPNEAWIGARRMAVALPVLPQAPEPVRQRILTEFQELIRKRFLEIPAYSYLTVPAPVRALLKPQIEGLDPASQKAFSEALRKIRS